jgi:glycosyltransferase involved in cell wall biosynthesis
MKEVGKPLVSVIIPTYNSQDWIEGLLKSILNQSYQNIELIVIDDGSDDNSLEIISRCLNNSIRINTQIVTQVNSGVSFSRNLGANLSSGEFLAFVDSDDIWFPEKLEKQVLTLLDSGSAAVSCSYAIFNDLSLQVIDVVHPDWSINGVRDWLLFRTYGGLLSSTLLIKREMFFQVGPFRDDLSLSADIEFAWRLLAITKVRLLKEPLVGYRIRPNQMHKVPSLLISEAQRMLGIVDILKSRKFSQIYLANLNLRIFLYNITDGRIIVSLGFLFQVMRMNFFEGSLTFSRIVIRRVKRKLVSKETKSVILPNP